MLATDDLFNALTDTFRSIGSKTFNKALLKVLNELLPVDHCVVFTFSKTGEAGHLFTQGRMDERRADKLAHDYVDSFYKHDPNIQNIFQTEGEFIQTNQQDLEKNYDPTYKQHFFNQNGLIDKASSVGKIEDGFVYCNFYRMTDSGLYSPGDRKLIERLLPAVTALISSHYRMYQLLHPKEEWQAGENHVPSLVHNIISKAMPPFDRLTGREREVCERIVLGYTSEAISLDLNIKRTSVITYRRRAYEKLGISTQNELFAKCLSTATAHRVL